MPVRVETRTCSFCGQGGVVIMAYYSWKAWKRGELIQVAAPYLPADVREQLISGTHPACWTAVFGEEEE